MVERTKDGLSVVTEQTAMQFLKNHRDPFPHNTLSPFFLMERIRTENPQIYRLILSCINAAPNDEAILYFKAGVQIAYELLRRQTLLDSFPYEPDPSKMEFD